MHLKHALATHSGTQCRARPSLKDFIKKTTAILPNPGWMGAPSLKKDFVCSYTPGCYCCVEEVRHSWWKGVPVFVGTTEFHVFCWKTNFVVKNTPFLHRFWLDGCRINIVSSERGDTPVIVSFPTEF